MDNETIELFKNLIYSIAKKYSYNNDDLEDLYQVGNVGLMHALENYKENSLAKFSTYAHFYIKGEILKYIRENRIIKRNYETDKLIRSISKVKEYLTQVNSHEATYDEIAEYLEVPVIDIINALNITSIKSMDYENDDSDKNLYEYESYIEKGYDEDVLLLKEEIEKLSPEERKIIEYRYFEGNSQKETSQKLGISQVQVSRKENKILTKIKNNIAI